MKIQLPGALSQSARSVSWQYCHIGIIRVPDVGRQQLKVTLRRLQKLTIIIEYEINAVVLTCARARWQALKSSNFSGPTLSQKSYLVLRFYGSNYL